MKPSKIRNTHRLVFTRHGRKAFDDTTATNPLRDWRNLRDIALGFLVFLAIVKTFFNVFGHTFACFS